MTSAPRRLSALLVPAALAASLLVAPPTATAAEDRSGTPTAAKAQCRRTLPAYPILRPGDRRRAVRTLQCSLNDLDLEVGPVVVDGYYGPQTKRAVLEIVSGFEGTELPPRPYRINNGFWTLLFGRQLPHRTLQEGDHGKAVKVLQRALRAAGGDLVVDGLFGPQTRSVVIAYQREHRVRPANGKVNADTRFFLGMGGVFGELNRR